MEELNLLMEQHNAILEKIDKVLLSKVELIARNFMRDKNNPLEKFTMAMGTYFFQDKIGQIRYDFTCNELEEFLHTYNEEFKITGNPICFTKEGKVVTDW